MRLFGFKMLDLDDRDDELSGELESDFLDVIGQSQN